jgi:hypothetical protein
MGEISKWRNNKDQICQVPSKVLRATLPITARIITQRYKLIYNNTDTAGSASVVKSFMQFVELYEDKEKQRKHPRVYVSY